MPRHATTTSFKPGQSGNPGGKPKRGRPSTYTEELGLLICEKLTEGSSLRSICEADDMPTASTVCKWLSKYPFFEQQYTRARETQTETLLEEILAISDENPVDQVGVQRQRNRLDTRKWAMSKMHPRRYGDRVVNELSGGIEIEDGRPQFTKDLDVARRVAYLLTIGSQSPQLENGSAARDTDATRLDNSLQSLENLADAQICNPLVSPAEEAAEKAAEVEVAGPVDIERELGVAIVQRQPTPAELSLQLARDLLDDSRAQIKFAPSPGGSR